MKRIRIGSWVVAAVMAAGLTLSAQAAGDHLLTFEGQILPAVRDGDVICAPFRALCEAVGYEVSWDGSAAVATGSQTLIARLGSQSLQIDRTTLSLTQPVQLSQNLTMVPVRPLAEALQLQVTYDATRGTAVIYRTGQEPPQEGTQEPDSGAASYSDADLYWLARIVEAEAGGESDEGKLAVANVVLNRMRSAQYPDTIYDVIFDTQYGTQFEPTANGTIYNTPSEESIDAARRALAGENNIGDALYFYNPSLVDAVWIRTNCTYVQTIGCHAFYV